MMRMVNTQEDISSSLKSIVMQDIRYYGRTHISLSNAFTLRRLLQARFNLDCITSLLTFHSSSSADFSLHFVSILLRLRNLVIKLEECNNFWQESRGVLFLPFFIVGTSSEQGTFRLRFFPNQSILKLCISISLSHKTATTRHS